MNGNMEEVENKRYPTLRTNMDGFEIDGILCKLKYLSKPMA